MTVFPFVLESKSVCSPHHEINRKAVTGHPFDFVIGSSHVVHGIDPYYPKYYKGRSEKTAYREYFESILENLNTYSDFDVYGHLDYPMPMRRSTLHMRFDRLPQILRHAGFRYFTVFYRQKAGFPSASGIAKIKLIQKNFKIGIANQNNTV